MVRLWRRYDQRLRSIILLHFGLVTFRFGYGRDRNSSFLRFRALWTCTWVPKRILFIVGGTRIPQQIQEAPQTNFWKYCFVMFQSFGNRHFWFVGKEGHRKHMKIRLTVSWKSWIWDQDLPENMKWKFGKMEPISSNKHEMEFVNFWNFETKQLWNQETKTLWNQGTWKPRNFETKKPRA